MKLRVFGVALATLVTIAASAATPQWIWTQGKVGTGKASFKKSFSLDAVPSKAPLAVSCDNAFTMKVKTSGRNAMRFGGGW